MSLKNKKYVSYSEYQTWRDCRFKHNIKYINNIYKSESNIYFCLGISFHASIQYYLFIEKSLKKSMELFSEIFFSYCANNNLENKIQEFDVYKKSAKNIFENLEFSDVWKNRKIIGVEVPVYENIDFFDNKINFKGSIDLIWEENDLIYICDIKVSSKGWSINEKSDKFKHYQLILYKYFYCKKFNIDPKKVETVFLIVKRNNKTSFEEFRITSGNKKINNCKNDFNVFLNDVFYGNLKYKNRLSCKNCPYYKTEYCL